MNYLAILIPLACAALIWADVRRRVDVARGWTSLLFCTIAPHFCAVVFVVSAAFERYAVPHALAVCSAWSLAIIWLYFLVRIFICPLRRRDSTAHRVRALMRGAVLLRIGLQTLAVQCVIYLFYWRVYRTNAAIFMLDTMVVVASFVLPTLIGTILILVTGRRLGVWKRIVFLWLCWVPVVNFFMLYYMYRSATGEYAHECDRAEVQSVRAESAVCQTVYPLLLVHGVGFRDLRYFNYWGRIPRLLMKNGATIYYGHQEAFGTIECNAQELAETIDRILSETGAEKVNIIAHSKGGLDARYLISTLGYGDRVASLTTISTPHRGSELLDYFHKLSDRTFRRLTDGFDRAFRKMGDTRPDAYTAANELSREYAAVFNEQNPDDARVYYQSYTTVMKNMFSNAILSIPYLLMVRKAGENDGLVAIESAKWGNFRGVLRNRHYRGIAHGDIIDLQREDYRGFDVLETYVSIVSDLKTRGY